MSLITDTSEGAVIQVRVVPRASRNQIDGIREEMLLVRLTAPPVQGAANDALIRLLGRALGIAPSRLEIVGGSRGTRKRVRVTGLTAADLLARLVPERPDK